MLKGLVTAYRTLSILPVPGKDAEDFSTALYGFVLVGATLGGLLFLEGYGLRVLTGNQWPEASAFIILATGVFLTRGFHLDGVADTADGFGGGYRRDRILEIMKDSRTGAFGVIALIMLLLIKWIVLVRLVTLSAEIALITAFVISRAILVELSVVYPYAREKGTAEAFVKGANQKHRFFTWIAAGGIVFWINGWTGLAILAISFVIARLIGWWSTRKIGGITGDVLGASCETIEVWVLFSVVFYEIIKII